MTTTGPSGAALEWAALSAGATTAEWVQALDGGTHAATDVLSLDGREFVLRRFPAGDNAVQRESRVLGVLGGLGGLAPQIVAADPRGDRCYVPAILTTRVPGRACVTPDEPREFAVQLGQALARIHGHSPGVGLPDVLPAVSAGAGPLRAEVLRTWTRLSGAPRVLAHHDYWSGNTLWHEGRLTGVVDWSGAGLAPAGLDVSWCRLDLILLYDLATADVFTSSYEAAVGDVLPDLDQWDLFAAMNADLDIESWAPNYQSLGRPDLGPIVLRGRLTRWTRRLTSAS